MLGRAHITVNKNAIPERPGKAVRHLRHPHRHPGRNHPWLYRAGSGKLANLIADVLDAPTDDAVIARVANEAQRCAPDCRCTVLEY